MELATAAQTVVGVGVKVACHGGGRSLDEDPLFLFCVFCFQNRRWNLTDGLYRGGERNGPMAAEIESVTGVERSDGRDFHTH
jgi:hypothetical protein